MGDPKTQVHAIAEQMLRDELDDVKVGRYDDWQSRTVFDVGDRVRVRCVFTDDSAMFQEPVDDYAWLLRDVTMVDLGIDEGPSPTSGGVALAECNVVERVDDEHVRLADPKILEFELSDAAVDKLTNRL